MSTKTEERPDTTTDEGAVPDWAIGYSLILPCDQRNPECDHEAEWFASQHSCIKAHLCDDHMKQTFADVNQKIARWGGVECRICKQEFTNFAAFIKCVRI